MKKLSIGVIGCGNMGQALVRGILKGKLIPAGGVVVWDADAKKLGQTGRSLKVRSAKSNTEVAGSSVILLAVKPQQMGAVIDEIRPFLKHKPLLISIAAGISTGWIEKRLNQAVPVVRVMPNTPALVGAGTSAIAGGRYATEVSLGNAEKIFRCVGEVVRVPEKWINAVTAVSGSGPAYFFFLMERMIRAGASLGLSADVAKRLVVQTALGAAALAASSKEDPAVLRGKVTSRGGTTEAAFKTFEKGGLGPLIEKGIRAAASRAKELGS